MRAQPVRSRGCGLPLLRPRPSQPTKLTIGARPRGFSLSQAQLTALAAGIDDAVEREWSKVLRRARQAEPAIDDATKKIANKQAEAIRSDTAVLSAAEALRQAIQATVEGKLARYRSLIKKYTTWLPSLRRDNPNLAAIRSISRRYAPSPSAVERTYTGPWAKIELPRGGGSDWDTSNSLQLGFSVPGDAVNVTVHARAGFHSWARYRKYYFLDFSVPAGAGTVDVEIHRDTNRSASLDDCFGFASGVISTGFMIYRVRSDGVHLGEDEPVDSSWSWIYADTLAELFGCGAQPPVPDPPYLEPQAPATLRFTAPSQGADYMLFVYAKVEAEVAGGGTSVVEQDVAIHRVVVRHRG